MELDLCPASTYRGHILGLAGSRDTREAVEVRPILQCLRRPTAPCGLPMLQPGRRAFDRPSVLQRVGHPSPKWSPKRGVLRTRCPPVPPSLDLDAIQGVGSTVRAAPAVTPRTVTPDSTRLASSPPSRSRRAGSSQQSPRPARARTQVRSASTSGTTQRGESNPLGQVPEALLGVGSQSGIYAPRTHSRLGGLVGSQGSSHGGAQRPATRGQTTPPASRTAAPSHTRSPERFRSSRSPSTESSASRSTPTRRPPTRVGSSASVYAPRVRSRVGAHTASRAGRTTTVSGGSSPRPTFAPRAQTRVGSGSRTNSSSSSVRPAPRTSRGVARPSSRVYAPSSRSRTSTPSRGPREVVRAECPCRAPVRRQHRRDPRGVSEGPCPRVAAGRRRSPTQRAAQRARTADCRLTVP